MEASASSPPQRSKAQQFWRLRRRRHITQLPATVAIVAGAILCVSISAELGAFAGYRTADVPGAMADLNRAHAHGLSLAGYGDGHASTERHLLSVADEFTCPVPGNSTSTFSRLSFEDNRGAAVVFMVFVTLYMFIGLAIVCDSFFEASLSAICEAMNLKDDVAGATWMAAGGSAPELATSFIGVFISFSDVGFGTIVGSAVFNVLFVIACCAFAAPNLKLTWWPLARDAAYYCFSLAMIVIFVSDDLQIAVWEASILLLMYVGYVTVMYFNERLEGWVSTRIEANMKEGNVVQKMIKKIIEAPVFAGFLYVVILVNAIMVILEQVEFNKRAAELPCLCGVNVGAAQLPPTAFYYINLAFNIFFIVEMAVKLYGYGFFGYWRVPLNCFDGSLVFLIVVEFILIEAARGAAGSDELADSNDAFGVGVARMLRLLKFIRFVRTFRVLRLARGFTSSVSVEPIGESTAAASSTAAELELGSKTRVAEGTEKAKDIAVDEKEAEAEDDDEDDGPFDPFEMWGDLQSPGGLFGRFMWVVGLPLSVSFWLTIPDCRRPMFAKYWFFTFSNCIIWIATLSFFMVWMVERLGKIYGVPDSIMGIFVLAAGTSIPDCLSSVAVARRGHGDMAVSSSIGSNIFDVLIGLPIPWFLYTAILRPAIGESYGPQWVPVQSEALAVMILLLFVMVALVVTTVHLSGWVLSVRLGGCMMGLYFVFLVFALLLDQKVIFPDCVVLDPAIGG